MSQHPHPEALYYHIANDALTAGKAETDEFRKKEQIATALVFAALCLETFINQEYAAHTETRKILEDDDKIPLESKWLMLPLLLGCSKTIDKGREPYQTFQDLIKTRNQRLVHFKPLQEGAMHGGRIKGKYFADLVSDGALAERYIACIGGMIRELASLTGGKTSVPKFLNGDRYMSTIWITLPVALEWS